VFDDAAQGAAISRNEEECSEETKANGKTVKIQS
jgi:hypothetical protein